MNIYRDIRDVLVKGYDAGEASAIAFLLLEEVAGMSRSQALMGDDSPLRDELLRMAERIAQGEPVQYVVGKAEFCGLTFHVEPGVLIPRPETEELVEAVELPNSTCQTSRPPRIVDIGTGSGCIAISLSKRFPDAVVEGWDISDDALRIATGNAALLEADIRFHKIDVLTISPAEVLALADGTPIDVIVSNPPYICNKEKADMENNVLDHEPHLALFVPDEDPLLFYRKIATLGTHVLASGGKLYFEINRAYGKETVAMLEGLSYTNVQLMQDQFGNDRMVCAIKP